VIYLYPAEERPGHNVKLYQYCSGNVEHIVQRHARASSSLFFSYRFISLSVSLQFDGERDTRVPHDFSNNSKLDDGDEDDIEEDEPEPIVVRGSAGSKRGGGDTKPGAGGAKAKLPANKPVHDVRPLLIISTKSSYTEYTRNRRWTLSPIVR
jgi:transcription factor RLM1